jgi:hypothetical protein
MLTSTENAAAASELCRLCAPEDLLDLAAYVVPFSEARRFDERLRLGRSSGWYLTGLDMMLRPWLRDRGEWRGRGFCCIWRDDEWPGDVAAAGIALHEFAHWLEDELLMATVAEEIFDLALPGFGIAELPQKFAVAEYDAQGEQSAAAACAWEKHGLRFIRAALHLHHRAQRLGIHIPLRLLNVAGLRYGLSPAGYYAIALGEEIRREAGAPLRPLLNTEPPAAAARLFALDTTDDSGRSWTEQFEELRSLASALDVDQPVAAVAVTPDAGARAAAAPRVLPGGAGEAGGDSPSNFSRV